MKFGDEFVLEFGDKFGESPNLGTNMSPNLGTNLGNPQIWGQICPQICPQKAREHICMILFPYPVDSLNTLKHVCENRIAVLLFQFSICSFFGWCPLDTVQTPMFSAPPTRQIGQFILQMLLALNLDNMYFDSFKKLDGFY